MMRVLISDLTIGTCDLTGKEEVECLRLTLDDGAGEVVCVPAELIKLLRLKKRQESGTNSQLKNGA